VGGDNDIDTGAHEVYREVAIEFGLSRRPAPLDDDRLTLHISEVAQTPSKCFGTCGLRSPWMEHAYSVHLRCLLRLILLAARCGAEERHRDDEAGDAPTMQYHWASSVTKRRWSATKAPVADETRATRAQPDHLELADQRTLLRRAPGGSR
jgi:hypothetical protein